MSIQEETAEAFPFHGGDFFSVRSSVQAEAVGRGLLKKMRDAQDAQHTAEYKWNAGLRGSGILTIDLELSTGRSIAEMVAEGEAQAADR